MAPSATSPAAQVSGPPGDVPAPKLYPVKEVHFENFVEPQTEGYRQAHARGVDGAAIVIDNGMPCLETKFLVTRMRS